MDLFVYTTAVTVIVVCGVITIIEILNGGKK